MRVDLRAGFALVLALLSLAIQSSAFQPPAAWSLRQAGTVRQPLQRRLVEPLLAKKVKRRKKAKPVAPSASEDKSAATPPSPEDFLTLAEELEEEFEFRDVAEEEDDFGGTATNTAVADGIEDDTGGLFDLPSVADLEQKRKRTAAAAAKNAASEAETVKKEPRIKRKDLKELRDLLELDPSADMLPETFAEDYDMTSMFLGEAGRDFPLPAGLGIGQAYLQSGHLILVLTCLLCAFVEYPGNPLTQLPTEIRDFLKSGLLVTYSINTVLAVLAIFRAGEKRLPVPFWTVKTFLLGGLAFDELNRSPAQAPKKKKRK